MVERGAAAGGLDGLAGAAQPTSWLGRRQTEHTDDLAVAAFRRGHGAPRQRASRKLAASRDAGRADRRAGGNPLYAEEFVRILRDRDLDGELPETIQGLIAARLDLLEPGQKLLVQGGAVLGKRFRIGGLASLSGLDRSALESNLHALERKEFLRRERGRTEGDSEYVFCHVLVRDVAYGQLPRADRAEKHLTAARWIETLGRSEDHAEMLAQGRAAHALVFLAHAHARKGRPRGGRAAHALVFLAHAQVERRMRLCSSRTRTRVKGAPGGKVN
jgi:hypothetical protein